MINDDPTGRPRDPGGPPEDSGPPAPASYATAAAAGALASSSTPAPTLAKHHFYGVPDKVATNELSRIKDVPAAVANSFLRLRSHRAGFYASVGDSSIPTSDLIYSIRQHLDSTLSCKEEEEWENVMSYRVTATEEPGEARIFIPLTDIDQKKLNAALNLLREAMKAPIKLLKCQKVSLDSHLQIQEPRTVNGEPCFFSVELSEEDFENTWLLAKIEPKTLVPDYLGSFTSSVIEKYILSHFAPGATPAVPDPEPWAEVEIFQIEGYQEPKGAFTVHAILSYKGQSVPKKYLKHTSLTILNNLRYCPVCRTQDHTRNTCDKARCIICKCANDDGTHHAPMNCPKRAEKAKTAATAQSQSTQAPNAPQPNKESAPRDGEGFQAATNTAKPTQETPSGTSTSSNPYDALSDNAFSDDALSDVESDDYMEGQTYTSVEHASASSEPDVQMSDPSPSETSASVPVQDTEMEGETVEETEEGTEEARPRAPRLRRPPPPGYKDSNNVSIPAQPKTPTKSKKISKTASKTTKKETPSIPHRLPTLNSSPLRSGSTNRPRPELSSVSQPLPISASRSTQENSRGQMVHPVQPTQENVPDPPAEHIGSWADMPPPTPPSQSFSQPGYLPNSDEEDDPPHSRRPDANAHTAEHAGNAPAEEVPTDADPDSFPTQRDVSSEASQTY